MKKKQKIVTFKMDEDLYDIITAMPNRSEFIRSAITSALGTICPLCNGKGILTHNQKNHWDDIADEHRITRCQKCNELFIQCSLAE